MTKAQEQAQKFQQLCQEFGFTYEVRGSCVKVSKRFAPGDCEAFTAAEMEAGMILDAAPLKGGSVWGSVGGYSGLQGGKMVMNKSGNGKRFLAALRFVCFF